MKCLLTCAFTYIYKYVSRRTRGELASNFSNLQIVVDMVCVILDTMADICLSLRFFD